MGDSRGWGIHVDGGFTWMGDSCGWGIHVDGGFTGGLADHLDRVLHEPGREIDHLLGLVDQPNNRRTHHQNGANGKMSWFLAMQGSASQIEADMRGVLTDRSTTDVSARTPPKPPN